MKQYAETPKPTEHWGLGVCESQEHDPVSKNVAGQWVFHTELLLSGFVFDPSFRLPLGLWVKSPNRTSSSLVSCFQLKIFTLRRNLKPPLGKSKILARAHPVTASVRP